MESSIKSNPGEGITTDPLLGEGWAQVLASLPADLEMSAQTSKALVRRRGIQHATDLLRMILAYAVCDWSLRLVGLWGTLLGLGSLSDVAILNRLRNSTFWLGTLLVGLLQKRGVYLHSQPGIHIQLVDASVITRPGSQGTDWRIHLSFDLGQMCLEQVQLTDQHGGESLQRFPGQAGVIQIADRIYAHKRSLEKPLQSGTAIVVRLQWNTCPLCDPAGQPFDVIAWLKQAFEAFPSRVQETRVCLSTAQGSFPLRLVACALPLEKAEKARQRARKASRKKGHTPYEKNLFAAGFVLVLSNLSQEGWSATQVMDLYRWRWQIELVVKRLKSLLILDGLRAKEARLAQTYLLAKLLAAFLLDELRTGAIHKVPDLLNQPTRPMSYWRLDTWLIQYLRGWICGAIPDLDTFFQKLPELSRYLCDPPRQRRQQLTLARTLLVGFYAC